MPPKRSRGKPALSRVPFLEGVNGDSDYSSSGENGRTAHPAPVPPHRRADIHLNQREQVSMHAGNQPCTNYPCGMIRLLTCPCVTCFVTNLRYCIKGFCWLPVPCVPLGWVLSVGLVCVMCLALLSPVLGLVLFSDTAIQTVNHNYKRGLSGDDFIAVPSCIAIIAFKVFVTKSSLSDCAVHQWN